MWRAQVLLTAVLLGINVYAQGPEFRLQPVAVTDVEDFTITDNEGSPGVPSEVTLTGIIGPDATVEFHIRLSDWGDAVGSPELVTYTAAIDGVNGYSSGEGVDLVPLGGCCPGDPASCFIDEDNPEWVHGNLVPPCAPMSVVSLSNLNYEFGSTILGDCTVPDDGTIKYGATLVLSIPPDAAGTYTIDFVDSITKTFMNDPLGDKILPLTLTAVLITVPWGACCAPMDPNVYCTDGGTETQCDAQAGPDGVHWFFPWMVCVAVEPCCTCVDHWVCDDWNLCTTDECVDTCWCRNSPNYDVEVYC